MMFGAFAMHLDRAVTMTATARVALASAASKSIVLVVCMYVSVCHIMHANKNAKLYASSTKQRTKKNA